MNLTPRIANAARAGAVAILIHLGPANALCGADIAASTKSITSLPADEPVVILTEANTRHLVHLEVGTTFGIQLPSNRRTGFSWRQDGEVIHGPCLTRVGKSIYEPIPASRGATGIGGTQTFFFVVEQPGCQILRFGYARPWATSDVIRRASFAIAVP